MNTPPAHTGDLRSRVQQALAAEIGPALDMDGSRIDIVAVHDGEVQLRLNGVCGNCPSSIMAVVMGIDRNDSWMLDRACDLGLAFQLANIARDVDEDDRADRRYLPVEWMVEEDIEPGMVMHPHHRQELADIVARLIERMERHEAWARMGAARLPFRSRWASIYPSAASMRATSCSFAISSEKTATGTCA